MRDINKDTLFEKKLFIYLVFFLSFLSIGSFFFYNLTGQAFLYNDAKSHLDIGRRVVEGLKPGFTQLGGVWLPLPHLLMIPTIWNDFMWHFGLSGALQSMVSFVSVGIIIFLFLKKLGVGLWGRVAGVLAFSLNSNVLYLQSTAMTELLLLATMLASCYELLQWYKNERLLHLIKSAFWIMLATLIRYDGWFLFVVASCLIFIQAVRRFGFKGLENIIIPFYILGGFGIGLWFLWNQIVFKDIFYFMLGPYSAHAQQLQIEAVGALVTKNNIFIAISAYGQAVIQNVGLFMAIVASIGAILFLVDKKIKFSIRIAIFTLLTTPLMFNILSLYLGYSALFVPGLSGDKWFNVRYGLMMIPGIAIFFGYFIQRLKWLGYPALIIFLVFNFISMAQKDSVVIQDAKYGGSGYEVSAISGWFHDIAANQDGFILISVASHDQIIFSSGLPMKRFVHQGTGYYWDLAVAHPDRYIRWIVMRTGDESDLVYRMLADNRSFHDNYHKVGSFPHADIYELNSKDINHLLAFPSQY